MFQIFYSNECPRLIQNYKLSQLLEIMQRIELAWRFILKKKHDFLGLIVGEDLSINRTRQNSVITRCWFAFRNARFWTPPRRGQRSTERIILIQTLFIEFANLTNQWRSGDTVLFLLLFFFYRAKWKKKTFTNTLQLSTVDEFLVETNLLVWQF